MAHLLLLAANATLPAQLPEPALFAAVAVLLVGIVLWIVFLRRLFPRPG